MREVPASVGQRLLWLMDRYRGESGALNEPLVWRLRGPLDHYALGAALDGLVARHEALRTTFASRRGRVVQRIHEPRRLPLTLENLSGSSEALSTALADEFHTRIDPTTWPIRARLWQLGPDDHVISLNLHHLATDRFSNAIVARDLGALHDRIVSDGQELPKIVWQYADWVAWQQQALDAGHLARLREFWSTKLAGGQSVVLPHAQEASGAPGERGYERRMLSAELAGKLRPIAKRCRTTMFPVALAAFYVHLHGLTTQRDLSIASLLANRSRPEIQRTVGFFVSMIMLRTRLDPAETFEDVVRHCRATLLEGLAHLDLPFQLLAPNTIRVEPEPGAIRADDVVFQLADGEVRAGDGARLAGLDVTPVDWEPRRSRFALELFLAYDTDGITLFLLYDKGRFATPWAREFTDGYARLLDVVGTAPQATVAQLLAQAA